MSAWVSGLPSNSSGRSAGNLTTPVLRRRDPSNTARSPSTRNSPSVIRFVISSHLDNHRGTHAAARAHRQHTDAAAAATQLIYRRRDHARAGRGDRMAEADARAVDVDDLFVKAEFARAGDSLSGKRLIDLEQRDILELATCQLERLRDGLDRPTPGAGRVQSDL